jgi:hypothetical protein
MFLERPKKRRADKRAPPAAELENRPTTGENLNIASHSVHFRLPSLKI